MDWITKLMLTFLLMIIPYPRFLKEDENAFLTFLTSLCVLGFFVSAFIWIWSR